MPNLQKKIAEKFITALSEDESFRQDQVQQIEEIVTSGKKPKPDELLKIFATQDEGVAI